MQDPQPARRLDPQHEERTLLQGLYDDRLMERDLKKHLRRFGLPVRNGAGDLPGQLRARLIEFLQEHIRKADEAGMEEEEKEEEEEQENESASDGSAREVATVDQAQVARDTAGSSELGVARDTAGSSGLGVARDTAGSSQLGVARDTAGSSELGAASPCAACGEPLSADVIHSSCNVCQARMHVRCAAAAVGFSGGVRSAPSGGRRGQRCHDCMAVAAALAVASARRTGWAAPDIFKDATALRQTAASLLPEAAAAIAGQAAAAASRERKRAIGQRAPPRVVSARAFWAARRVSERLRKAMDASQHAEQSGALVDDGCVDVNDCRRVLESGTGELFFHSLAHIDETTTLRAVACVCRAWSQLLDRSRSAEAAALWRSAWLTVPRGKLTLAAAIRTTRPGDRIRILRGTHAGALAVPHALEIVGEPGAVLTGPLTLSGGGMGGSGGGGGGGGGGGSAAKGGGGGGGDGARRGVVRGIRFEHFYETAVTVLGGRWALKACEIASSRAPNRACAGVVLRGTAAVEVSESIISGASSALILSSASARLLARHTTLTNTRAAIEALRAGYVDVQQCVFDAMHGGDVGLRLAADTAGVVGRNTVRGDESFLWGRLIPPKLVQTPSSEDDGDDDKSTLEAGHQSNTD